jgi:hypothetical protein
MGVAMDPKGLFLMWVEHRKRVKEIRPKMDAIPIMALVGLPPFLLEKITGSVC